MTAGPRRLSVLDATFLVIGAILGVGIFFNPQQVAALVPDETAYLATWGFGCFLALCGAFTFAELAAVWPRAGGSFVYLREIYGRPAAFLLAWVVLFVVSTGALAVMVGFGAAMLVKAVPTVGAWGAALGLSETGTNKALGALLIIGLHAFAIGGVKTGATVQNLIMGVKLLLVTLVMGGAWLLFSPGEYAASPPPPESGPLWRGMTLAMLPVLFSCGGWPLVSYLSSEVEDPARNLPRALVLGVGVVVVIYLTLNLAYLRVVGLGGVAGNPGFAGVVVERVFGASAGAALTLGMAISAVGVTLVNVLTSPWLYVAMAREGLFFRRFGQLNARTGAPVAGLATQATLALLYLFLADADFLVDSAVFVEWIFHVLIAGGLLWLRARRPDLPRPYRSPLYPLLPLVYAVFAIYLVVMTLLQNDPEKTLVGGGITLLGVVVYLLWERLRTRGAPA